MKLPSFSSSSSSSSSASSCSAASAYHLNSDAAAAGCFSGIFRRLICGTLDVGSSSRSRVADAWTGGAVVGAAAEAPTDQKAGSLNPPATPPTAASPGLVARLMGLDSMAPELPSAPPGPISRSRSTGSLDGWPPPPLLPVQTHRRSHSFRETPTFLRPENDEFLLLSFSPENGWEGEGKKRPEPPPTPANHETGLRQLDQRDGVEEEAAEKTPTKNHHQPPPPQQQQKKKKIVQRKASREKAAAERCRRQVAPPHKAEALIITGSRRPGTAKTAASASATHRETPEITRPAKRGDNNKKSSVVAIKPMAELECSSQNSSPVSVLDLLPELDGESITDTSTPISEEEEEEEPRSEGSPRRKLSSPSDCFDDPSQFFHLIPVEGKQGSTAAVEGIRARDAASLPRCSSRLWGEACRLAGGDAQRQPWKTQDPEELAVEFGLQILESLLRETVDEICHVPAAAAPPPPQLICTVA